MSAYRDDVAALAARHDALAAELADKTREVADAARLLDEARARRARPVLDNLRIASPCPADWSQMVGDERVRACASCQKNVYNLSELTREEAEALILEKEGDLCARYYQRKDGTILLKDCELGVSRRRKQRLLAAGAATLLAGTGLYAARQFLGIGAPDHACDAPIAVQGGLSIEMARAMEPPSVEVLEVEANVDVEPPPTVRLGQMVLRDPARP